MKKFKKLLVSTMALMMAFGTVACGGGGGGNTGSSSSSQPSVESSESTSESSEASSSEESEESEVSSSEQGGTSSEDGGSDYTPTNPYKLNVFSFSGGYGRAWFDSLAARYKKERAGDVIVVDGKTYDGIDFNFTGTKDIMSSMAASGATYDVWFQEQVYYNQLVRADKTFKDMTDVLTSDNPYEPGVTLESKLTAEQQDYYKRNGSYYGIPHYAGYVGIVYNKKMFEENLWYFVKDYDKELLATNPDMCFVIDAEEDRTPGPDGVEGTEDDGLPTTYAEFYALCDIISMTNVPLSWAGKYRQEYLNWFLTALTANHEGLDQMSLNYSFNGTATDLISVTEDAEGNVTETSLGDVVLDAQTNGYQLAAQRGKYYALDFLETIVDYEWCTSGSLSTTYEQTAAQEDFVRGTMNASDRAAMLIDGCWWEMEAANSFLALEQAGNKNPKDNFGWLPLPCIDDAAAEARAESIKNGGNGYTLTDTHNSLCFIGKQVSDDVYAIAKDFIQFAYTDESLADFSIITDTTKAVKYTMTAEQKAQMSAYGRSLMEMQEKSDIVYTFSKEAFYQMNESSLSEYKKTFSSIVDGNTVDIAVDSFKAGVSASKYFSGMLANQQKKWDSIVKA